MVDGFFSIKREATFWYWLKECEEDTVSQLRKMLNEVKDGYKCKITEMEKRIRQIQQSSDNLESVSKCGTRIDLVNTMTSGREQYEKIVKPVNLDAAKEWTVTTIFPCKNDVRNTFGHVFLSPKAAKLRLPEGNNCANILW